MKWKLSTFLIVVPLLAVLLALVIENVNAPRPFGKVSVIMPTTEGELQEMPEPSQERIIRSINQMLQASMPNQKVDRRSPICLEPGEAWIDDPRDFPLIGEARLQHKTWHCEFDSVSNDGTVIQRSVVVDVNHFHFD